MIKLIPDISSIGLHTNIFLKIEGDHLIVINFEYDYYS